MCEMGAIGLTKRLMDGGKQRPANTPSRSVENSEQNSRNAHMQTKRRSTLLTSEPKTLLGAHGYGK